MSMYDDMIYYNYFDLKHSKMTIYERSAQFAPFAALTGYSDEIKETSRITYDDSVLLEDYNNILDYKINKVKDTNQEIKLLYFSYDEKKAGGEYVSYKGILKDIDYCNKKIVFKDGLKIDFSQVKDISI